MLTVGFTGAKIVLGDGDGDAVGTQFEGGDFIKLGNGQGDKVAVNFLLSSGDDVIIFGNGNNDSVATQSSPGGNTIVTGTGNSDTVGDPHSGHSDTFGFALGTGATALSQTTVTGAREGDHVAVGNVSAVNSNSALVLTSAGGLGNTLIQEGGSIAGLITVNDFIKWLMSHVGLTSGDTYTADNAGKTFVVTDTTDGHVGGIEIVGVFEHNTLANHILTLG